VPAGLLILELADQKHRDVDLADPAGGRAVVHELRNARRVVHGQLLQVLRLRAQLLIILVVRVAARGGGFVRDALRRARS
jgi:hypothetical protein